MHQTRRLFILGMILFAVVSLIGCSSSGSSGGDDDPSEEVTITGTVTDGTASLGQAACRFVDLNKKKLAEEPAAATGVYHMEVPPETRGFVSCAPSVAPRLRLVAYVSTVGHPAGVPLAATDVNPTTTIVATILQREAIQPVVVFDLDTVHKTLVQRIADGDARLTTLVEAVRALYPPLRQAQLDVDFAGAEDGGDPGEGEDGAEGDAGDGAEASPLPFARCDFGLTPTGADVLDRTVLGDLCDNGHVDRPDVDDVAAPLPLPAPEALVEACAAELPAGAGIPLETTADAAGQYFLPIPPGVEGFVRCSPQDLPGLRLSTFVPKRPPEQQRLSGQDVNPQTTVFSTQIATELRDDLATTKANFLTDLTGLGVKVTLDAADVTDISVSDPATVVERGNPEVALVAFSATALFNALFKQGLNVDYPKALADFVAKREVDPAFLETELGLPAEDAADVAGLVNEAVDAAEADPAQGGLGTTLATALGTARIQVRVTDADATPIQGADLDIASTTVGCDVCGTETTNATGELLLTLTNVPEAEPLAVTVEATKEGFTPVSRTLEVVAFATVDTTLVLGALPRFTLTVTPAGEGQGMVTSIPAGIACTPNCTATYPEGSRVTLTAVPAEGSTFSGWSGGGCIGTAPCTVEMEQAQTVTATFSPTPEVALVVQLAGTGGGRVTSAPAGIDCGTNCTRTYPEGTRVTLTAAPTAGWRFQGWSGGGCSGSTPSCTVQMDQVRTVTATFVRQVTLTVRLAGSGSVRSTPAGITCPADCAELYDSSTRVTLTATPAEGWRFQAWSGEGCSGSTPSCPVEMDQVRTVTATFVRQVTLTVRIGGSGSVRSTPAGITCPEDCAELYDSGTRVTLTATPAAGWRLQGWSGEGCSGSNVSCTVEMDQARTVTATFIRPVFTLTVRINGSGSVQSTPAGIACPSDCTQTYDSGTRVTLTATSAAGWLFQGWSGEGCSGSTPSCTIGMDRDRIVTVTFAPPVSPTCSGTEVGGFCWYFGEENVSCNTVCATHGGYNDATRTYAGSSGSPENCRRVLVALNIALDEFFETAQGGIGCFALRLTSGNFGGFWDVHPTTADATYGVPGRRRSCACQR
jgi:hypothetical protein